MGLADIFSDLNLILVFIAIFLVTYYVWNILSKNSNAPPGPTPWPIVGNLPTMIRQPEQPTFRKFLDLREKYGNIVSFKLGSRNCVILFGHKLIHEALVEKGHLTKFRPDIYLARRLSEGTGVILSNGEHWQYLRKFTLVTLKDFGLGKKSLEERTREEAEIVCEVLSRQKGKVQLKDVLPNATANIISGIIFGNRFEYDDAKFNKLLEHLNYFFSNAGVQMPENVFPILEKLPFSKIRQIMINLEDVYSFIRSQIEEHRKTYDPNCLRDIIDLYIEETGNDAKIHNENITEKSLLIIIRDLYNAGSETTSTSLLWIILFMVKYPEVQRKCREEMLKAVGRRAVTTKDRELLPYLVSVIYEIQRMANIAPMAAPHCSIQDMEIGGKSVPKNTMILGILWSVHYDKDYWENPEEFRPERFLDENGKPKKPEAFYPFSIGPRTCIGKQLSEMELFIFLTTMLQRFEFKHADPKNIVMEGSQGGITHMPASYQVYVEEQF